MDSHSPADVKKEVALYIKVFVALMVLTVVTVGVSYLHLPVMGAVAVALVIAAFKGSLVASYFMHLIAERKLIYFTLILTVVFFIFLMFIPLFTGMDTIGTPLHLPTPGHEQPAEH